MIFPDALCTLLGWPSRKNVLKLLMLLFRHDGPYITQLLEGNYFTNAARSTITTNLKQEVRDYVYTFMYPEEYTLTESIAESDFHSSTSGKEELNGNKDEDECQ